MGILGTSENFVEYLNALGKSDGLGYECIPSPTYEDYEANNFVAVGCGNYRVALSILFSYVIMVILIFLNLFIAIILNSYQDI